jgi:hypothetical protein
MLFIGDLNKRLTLHFGNGSWHEPALQHGRGATRDEIKLYDCLHELDSQKSVHRMRRAFTPLKKRFFLMVLNEIVLEKS